MRWCPRGGQQQAGAQPTVPGWYRDSRPTTQTNSDPEAAASRRPHVDTAALREAGDPASVTENRHKAEPSEYSAELTRPVVLFYVVGRFSSGS